MRWIDSGTPQSWGSHRTSNANLSVKRSAAARGWRGAEEYETGESGLRGGIWVTENASMIVNSTMAGTMAFSGSTDYSGALIHWTPSGVPTGLPKAAPE